MSRWYYIFVRDKNTAELIKDFLVTNGIQVIFDGGHTGYDAVIFIPGDKKEISEHLYYLSIYYKFVFRRINL